MEEDIREVLLNFLRDDVDLALRPEQEFLLDDEDEGQANTNTADLQAHVHVQQHVSPPAILQQQPAAASGVPRSTGTSSGAALTSSTASVSNVRNSSDQLTSKQAKKRPTSQQRVALLEQRLLEETQKLQRLSLDNQFMRERVRTLELVINVREVQLARLSDIYGGLQDNPFEILGKTAEEMKAMMPPEAAAMFADVFGRAALVIAPLLPVLEQHPALIVGPAPGCTWADVREGRVALPQGVQEGQVEGWASLDGLFVAPEVVQDVYRLVQHVDRQQSVFKHLFLMNPQLLLAWGVHTNAVTPQDHASWQDLATAITSLARQGTGQEVSEPLVAPKSHWRTVSRHLRLTEHQRLQTATLCDIMARPLAEMLEQRNSRVRALTQLTQRQRQEQQEQHQQQLLPATSSDVVGHSPTLHANSLQEALQATAALPLAPAAQLPLPADPGGSPGGAAMPASSALHVADAMALLERQNSTPGGGQAEPGVPEFARNSQKSAGGSSDVGAPRLARHSTGVSSVGGASAGGVGSAGSSRPLPCTMVLNKSAQVLQEEESLLRQLQHTLAKEAALIVLACEVFCRHIITPVQMPLIMINAYPYILDVLALMHAISDEFTPQARP